ncbi:hypothetical protein D3C75_1304010 [compost metagenome]
MCRTDRQVQQRSRENNGSGRNISSEAVNRLNLENLGPHGLDNFPAADRRSERHRCSRGDFDP